MATIRYKDKNGQWQDIAVEGGESVEVVDNLESDSATAALSANQGRVLKEMIGQAHYLLLSVRDSRGDTRDNRGAKSHQCRRICKGC